jgi:predicted phosphoribosyltransferase
MKFIVVSSVAMMGVAAGRESAAELQTELDVITLRMMSRE